MDFYRASSSHWATWRVKSNHSPISVSPSFESPGGGEDGLRDAPAAYPLPVKSEFGRENVQPTRHLSGGVRGVFKFGVRVSQERTRLIGRFA